MIKSLFILFVFPIVVFTYDGMIHLHINDLGLFYKNMSNNKVFLNIKNTDAWGGFEYSKLYKRLFQDIEKIDPSNKILNFKNFKKLPNRLFDFYLMDIENESFVAKVKLEKSQSSALINIDLNKLKKISFMDKIVYTYHKIYLVFDDDYLYLSNNLSYLKLYLKDSNSFNTKVVMESKYKNYIYLNIKKIKKTPYLNNYWFTSLKDFNDLDSVIVEFNLNNKYFEEQGTAIVNNNSKNIEKLKVIDGDFKIKLFNSIAQFKVVPFNETKGLKVYSMVSNDFNSILYLAKYNSNVDFKKYLKSLSASAVLVENKILEYHYGVMNRKIIYIKRFDDYVLFSNDIKLFKDIKLKDSGDLYQKIEIFNFKNISKEIFKISEIENNNYSYNIFLSGYLNNYMKIKSFIFNVNIKDRNKLKFNTKIIF